MLKNLRSHPDYILVGISVVLIIFGILILASVSAPIAQEKFGTTYHFLNHQLLFGLLPGLILGFFAFRIRLDFLKKMVPFLLLINLILLAMVFLPKIGSDIGTAARWVSIGPFSFQPSEFLKLTFILYLAAWLSKRNYRNENFSHTLFAFLIIIGLISLFLIFQPDISTLGIIVLISAFMYFWTKTPSWHTILMFFGGIGSLFVLIKLAPYRLNRFLVFLNPETDPMGIGYQIKQSLIAVGSGGVAGLGLGMSGQKFGFLPLPQSISDSIFAIMANEMGFIGSLILISLFLIFLWRGFKISKLAQNQFCQLTALGISSWIVLQSFVNIGAMIGILPLTGIPLPFISYGGSALISELVGVGILLNISKNL